MSTTNIDTNDDIDLDEPPPTDPSPGVQMSLLPRIDNPDDDLETRLAWLEREVRATSAEHAKKKRDGSVLTARENKTAVVIGSARTHAVVDLPKVTLALGVDPQRDPTFVGHRMLENEWEFDVSDPEELSRTLPLDPRAEVPDPLPLHAQTKTKNSWRQRVFVVTLSVLGGILVGAFLQQSLMRSSGGSANPRLNRGIGEAARGAEIRYKDWETVRILLAPNTMPTTTNADPSEVLPTPSTSAMSSPPASTHFPWVKPIHTQPKPARSAFAPGPPSSKPHAPTNAKNTLGF